VTRGQLPQRAGSLGLNGGGAAAVVRTNSTADVMLIAHAFKTRV